jgi:hypothetical protein
MELTYPEMMENGRDYRVSQYCDQVTQYMRTGDDAWFEYLIHDCNNKVAYKLEYEMQMFSFEMKWKIKDKDDNVLAQAIKPFSLWEPPVVEFTSLANGTIGKIKQNWCGNTCFEDSWNIMVERPDVVEHSVFVYLALIIRNIQLERQKDNSRRRLRSGADDGEAAEDFDIATPPVHNNNKLD